MDQIERESRWREICREFRDSGQTRRGFCESRRIALSTLGYWLTRLSKRPARKKVPGFVPVGTVELSRKSMLRIHLGGEVVAELDLPVDETVIRDVLRAARSL